MTAKQDAARRTTRKTTRKATRRIRIAVAAALVVGVTGAGAALATVDPGDERPASVTSPQPRTPERISRDRRRPHRLASPKPSRTPSKPPAVQRPVVSRGECGVSYYEEPQGTANGERFDPNALTAAHKSLPFNTRVRVINPKNKKSVVVRINDRGPYIAGRCIDLSRAAFAEVAPLGAGVIHARYEVLGRR